MELLFRVTEQIIEHLTEDKKVVANSKNYLKCKFEFSEEWQSVTKTAIFTAASGKAFEYILENDACVIPHEVINFPHFTVSVFGGDLITVNSVSVNVLKSGYKEGETPKEPTPDVYTQILAKMTHTEEIAESMSEAEKLRVGAENDRASAENERQENERSRAKAETQRETLKGELETLKEETEDIVKQAETELEKVGEATDRANEAATHQPKIGENKNWFVWDIEKEEYVDTGVLAEVGVVQETGDSETVAMSQKATTEALLTLANKVAPSPASVTLYADRWEYNEESKIWYQEVEVANATITPNSKVNLQIEDEHIAIFAGMTLYAENYGGTITVKCSGGKPEENCVLQVTVSEAIVNGE